ncbi:MAG: hypothetical protein IKV59_10010, partial [Lachnospiraceae bacterium]|nr:hypothetical protein [Lachnospiraceae bacterium]
MMTEEQKISCAKEALKLSRFRLLEKIPALGAAFYVPGVQWTDQESGTDAEVLYWNVDEVLRLFRKSGQALQRRYLHLLFHGLYLHRFRKRNCPEKIWWLACDLLTEYRIDRMHIEGFAWPIPAERNRVYRKIREEKVAFYESSLAEWLLHREKEELREWENVFRKDNHVFWLDQTYIDEKKNQTGKQAAPDRVRQISEAVHLWRSAFEQLELRSEEHKKQAGGSAGVQAEKVVLEKERGYDYRQFLKQFAVCQEELSLDMDSFDYIPYDYSRRMYENLVFLEPLEYRDMHKLQEFVIAIDTSGSCSGEIVKQFLNETWEIFQEKDNFFEDMRIHIMQCDCLIQEHVCVSCEEEWKQYLENFTVLGHGDTDFTPVFRRVDQMIRDGEVKRLKGLLYFTDGDGIYPSQRPAY